MDEDLAVYSFSELGGENDLAGLLDEDSNAFNDDTFGDLGDPSKFLFLTLHISRQLF